MHSALPSHDVVLLGVGHTNAHVLRMWKMHRPPDARLTCVSNFPTVTYSGMLPGVLSGQYPPERMQIDLVRACAASGARLIVDEVVGLDAQARTLQFADRPDLPFDVLSIGIGSIPTVNGVEFNSDSVVPIKPMQTFRQRLGRKVGGMIDSLSGDSLRVAIIGGGVAGVEIAFCLPHTLEGMIADRARVTLLLVNAHRQLAPGMNERATRQLEQELRRRGVALFLEHRVEAIAGRELKTNRETLTADLVIWATGAAPPPLLSQLPLTKDPRGFLLTRPTLEVQDAASIFAVGDTGTIAGLELPKAGVYAVREGPVLWDNIQRQLRGEVLSEYDPQRDFLRLVNLGDGRALGQWRGLTYSGRLAWKLKDSIDTRFMDKYQDYSVPDMSQNSDATPAKSTDGNQSETKRMRCTGCGGKVGGQALRRALARLKATDFRDEASGVAHPRQSRMETGADTQPAPQNGDPLWGLDAADDVAVLAGDTRPWLATTDFFAAPFDDPFTVGRIAALNAISDIFASGGRPASALTIASIPYGSDAQQEQILFDVLAGALREFQPLGIRLVGGHTIEGPRLTIGFTILGHPAGREAISKTRPQPGDRLVLTKPLGTGVLLAAHMQAACCAEWFEALLATMLSSNAAAAARALQHDVHALTDVTGFGLAGHLAEMLTEPRATAELWLDRVPLLPGVTELLQSGFASTLEPANRTLDIPLQFSNVSDTDPAVRALFDPQTHGGLLLSLPADQAERFCRHEAAVDVDGPEPYGGYEVAGSIIGEITQVGAGQPQLRVLSKGDAHGR